MELTVVFRKVPDGYIGWVEELPGANTQGSTLAEAQENILEAIQMTLEANHELTGAPLPSEFTIKEKVSLALA
jgi:predicted RNase H-like HicB family nuclease